MAAAFFIYFENMIIWQIIAAVFFYLISELVRGYDHLADFGHSISLSLSRSLTSALPDVYVIVFC
jgi:hypothetical protein